jgi:SAM-dependent methyltransferase
MRQSTKSSDEAVLTDPNHFNMVIDNYTELTDVNRSLLTRRLPHYRKLLGDIPKNWLEIGPGSGAFGDAVTQSGAFWLGVEIDKNMAAHMRSQGKNVVHADFAVSNPDDWIPDEIKNQGGFDIVHFTQVFEHVVKPTRFLENAFSLLRPGGIIHIDVPHHNGLTGLIRKFNIFGSGYGEITPPHHMISYGKNTLRSAIESTGFLVDDLFSCANNDPVFGLAHAHLMQDTKLRIIWSASRMFGLGGNLVALAHKPLQ